MIADAVDAVDDLSAFLAKPSIELPKMTKKIVKRRSTVCASGSKRAAQDAPAPVGKVSRIECSPMSAEPDNQSKLSGRAEQQVSIAEPNLSEDDGKKLSICFPIEISFQ